MLWFVLGNVGSGKSTLCKKLASYGYKHLALGELLRKEQNPIIQACMREGKLIPSKITVTVLKRALEEAALNEVILIDGFPRNTENICEWNSVFGEEPTGVLYLDCEEKICLERLLARKRFDDTEKCIGERFESFKKETIPVIDYYKRKILIISPRDDLEWIMHLMNGEKQL